MNPNSSEENSGNPTLEISPFKNFNERVKNVFGNFLIEMGNTLKDAENTEEVQKEINSLSFSTLQGFFNPMNPFGQKSPSRDISQNNSSQHQLPPPSIGTSIPFANKETERKSVQIDFLHIFEGELEILSANQALDLINQEGSEIGYRFKKGPVSKSGSTKYFSIYCKYKQRNKKKKKKGDKASDEESAEDVQVEKELTKVSCNSYYRFKSDEKAKDYSLITYYQTHTHPPIDIQLLTQSMKNDLSNFPKRMLIIDIVKFLESKYRCSLDYHNVYREFRKTKPLFGEEDCISFINYLKSLSSGIEYMVDDSDSLKRLFFVTPIMKKNYDQFGDVLLLDATYQTNVYQVPLAIFSGVNVEGKNVVYAMAFINDETFETYEWCFKAFFDFYKDKVPNVIVTDGDLSICKVMKEKYPTIPHLLCQWHFKRNLYRHFAYLKKDNKAEYDKIFKLVDTEKTEDFDTEALILENFFDNQTCSHKQKSQKYFKDILEFKTKWATSYCPVVFTAGVHTTSRAESVNRMVKRYVNQRSEVSAMIDLILDLEKTPVFESNNRIMASESDSILQSIKENVGEIIYKRHKTEFNEHGKYSLVVLEEESNVVRYRVYADQIAEAERETKGRIVIWGGNTPLVFLLALYYLRNHLQTFILNYESLGFEGYGTIHL